MRIAHGHQRMIADRTQITCYTYSLRSRRNRKKIRTHIIITLTPRLKYTLWYDVLVVFGTRGEILHYACVTGV